MSTQFYNERRKDKAADREADRADRQAERAESRRDQDAELRRVQAAKKAKTEQVLKARQARAVAWSRRTAWATANRARIFVWFVMGCSIVPAVISQVGALTDAKVHLALAALLAAMMEGTAWAMHALGAEAEAKGKPAGPYRAGMWAGGLVAAAINYWHGTEQYKDHGWVAWVLALSSLVAVWLVDRSTHAGSMPTRAERKAKKAGALHAKKRAHHHADVLEVAQRLLSAAPYGRLSEDDAWLTAWHYVHGVPVAGVTAELIGAQLTAEARVQEVISPAPVLDPEMPPDPFLDDADSVYLTGFPAALEAASRPVPGSTESLGGKGLPAPHKAPQKPLVGGADRPLDDGDVKRVRDLARVLRSSGQSLTTTAVRKLLGCRAEYAVRVRHAVESGSDGDGPALAGAR